jgi:ankyrin repeat protein
MKDMIKAAITGNITLLQEQIKAGRDVNSKDNSGKTLLMNAVIENRLDIAKFLIQEGADVNLKDSIGYTALNYAAQDFSIEMCKLLLENKAMIDTRDENGNTLLFRALSSSKGRAEVIKLLLSYGADKNLKNKNDVSPMDLVNTIRDLDVRKFLTD